jgi:hypothetical protein
VYEYVPEVTAVGQWGGRHRKQAGRLLDGHTYDEMPKALDALRRTLKGEERRRS